MLLGFLCLSTTLYVSGSSAGLEVVASLILLDTCFLCFEVFTKEAHRREAGECSKSCSGSHVFVWYFSVFINTLV